MTLDLELGRPGRHRGALLVGHSRDDSAYGRLEIPVFSLIGAPGPTVLFTGGVHGDEHEGPIVLAELVRRLDPAGLRGRVVVVPRANLPAARAARRTSPVDGGNLARLFPGDPAGGLTAAIAAAITTGLLPLADAVVDLHAGGASLDNLPCSWGRLPRVAQALAAGIPAMAAELGGAGAVSPASLALARRGCRNVLMALGVLEGAVAPPGRLLRLRPSHFLRSPGFGLFEPAVPLGLEVQAGEPAGWLHDPERPEEEPRALAFPASGLLLCRRVPAPCVPGDVLLHLAEDTDRAALL